MSAPTGQGGGHPAFDTGLWPIQCRLIAAEEAAEGRGLRPLAPQGLYGQRWCVLTGEGTREARL